MIRTWKDFEGVSLDGRYWLRQCLSETDEGAWYLTRTTEDAVVRVLSADAPYALDALAMWREAVAFDCPNLARMLDAGRADAEGADVVYAVCENPDDFLSAVLDERPLTSAEGSEVLRASLSALAFLHGRGLAHGAVDPTQIMAFGDQIKLPSYTIRRAGHQAPAGDPGPHVAPEVAAGQAVTRASDMWSLGVTLYQILTRELPDVDAGPDVFGLPEPFAAIVRHTLRRNPDERWTVTDIDQYLNPPEPALEPTPEPLALPVAAPEPAPEPPRPAAMSELPPLPAIPAPAPRSQPPLDRGFPIKWAPALGLVAAVALSAVLFRRSDQPAPAPAPAPATRATTSAPKPRPAPPVAPPAAGAPRASAVPSTQSAIWRVVAYTYSNRAAAEKMVRKLAEKHPAWHAHVFTPNGERYPFYVALGGRMTLAQAQALQREARAKGLPRDTFVRNFPN